MVVRKKKNKGKMKSELKWNGMRSNEEIQNLIRETKGIYLGFNGIISQPL